MPPGLQGLRKTLAIVNRVSMNFKIGLTINVDSEMVFKKTGFQNKMEKKKNYK